MTDAVLKRIALRARLNDKYPIGTGNFKEGNVLIIAEEHNHPDIYTMNRPFNSTKHCSGWLNKKLDEENIDEHHLFWVNSRMGGGNEIDLQDLIDKLKPSLIVTLGGVASNHCKKLGLAHTKVYHPQYWKRFRSKERYPLFDILKEHIDGQPVATPVLSN